MPDPASWWAQAYPQILAEFGWHESADRVAAEVLHRRLPPRDTFRHVGTELKHRPRAVVVGCGPSLDDLRAADLPQGIVVAADGATARLRELGVVPRVVVTDLDGDDEALRWAGEQGSSMVVHAHGDNQDALQDLVPELGPFVAGTYQSTPDAGLAPMRNLGGFTDGDRAALLCEAYAVREVHLVAFDLEAAPGRYSGRWDPATKPAKLAWAGRVLAAMAARGTTTVSGL